MQPEQSATDEEVVRRAAHLVRIDVPEGELPAVAAQFGRILQAFRALQTVDVTGVEPLTGATTLLDVVRADRVAASLSPDEALANAPQREGDFFGVPKTVGGEA
jgi:aspartyl-tRNA(Asn)/glutamyl-tRNA(Gln) amidotransferase subunit C